MGIKWQSDWRVIVSGLARGIDACAHKGALSSATGTTIGILGCGVDVIYPKENRKIFAEIEQRGAIISEFPMGAFPAPQNFPICNPLIAGMARGVVVVEGAQYSGSLVEQSLGPAEKTLYAMLEVDSSRHVDDFARAFRAELFGSSLVAL